MVLPDNLRHFRKVRGPRARRVSFVFQALNAVTFAGDPSQAGLAPVVA